MPSGGGINAKISAHYEDRIAVSHLLDLLDDQHDSCLVRFEQPGDDGFEWWVEHEDGTRQYTQVKRQLARDTSWSVSQLSRLQPSGRSVLEDFRARLVAEPGAECVFASTVSATHLQDLTESARLAADFQEFDEELVISEPKRKSLDAVCAAWGGVGRQEAWELLRRVRVRMLDSDSLDRLLNAQSRMLISGPTTDAVPVLESFVRRHLCEKINTKQAWDELRECAGLEPTDWHLNANHMLRIGEQTRRLRERIDNERYGALRLPRPQAQQVAGLLLEPPGRAPQVVTLLGEAGVGKSGALAQALEQLDEQALEQDGTRPVVLAVRVDRLGEFHDAIGLGAQMHLPGSPAVVLARAAGRERAVLVLDQIDAFGVGSGRNPAALEAIEDVVADARALRVRVLLVCRAFEMEADERIRRLIAGDHSDRADQTHQPIEVGQFDREQVKEALAEELVDGEALPPQLLELLRVPLHLHMMIMLRRNGLLDSAHIRTRLQLFDCFYDCVLDRVRRRDPGAQAEAATGRLAELLSARQALTAPEAALGEHRSTVGLLASEGWLRSADGKVGFAHEAFFDHAYARRHLSSGLTLRALLGGRDQQRLFRRSQVRQILLLEREQDREAYLEDVRDLLSAQDIRPHLKEVVIALVTRVPDPWLAEWDALGVLGPVASNALAEHAHALAAQAPAFGQLLLDRGVVADYLRDLATIPVGTWLSRLLVNRYARQVAALWAPRMADPSWALRAVQVLNAAQLSQHEDLIDLFVAYLDAGHADKDARHTEEPGDGFFHRCYGLRGSRAPWCARLIAAWLRRRLAVNIADEVWATKPDASGRADWAFSARGRLLASSAAAGEILTTLAREDPIAYAEHLLPPVRAAVLAARTGAVYDSGEEDRVFAARTWIAPLHDPDLVLFEQLLVSLRAAVERGHGPALTAVREMAASPMAAEQALAAVGFATGHLDLTADALRWLEQGPHALAQGRYSDHHALSAEVLTAVSRAHGPARCAAAQQRAAVYRPNSEQDPAVLGTAARRLLRDIADEQLDRDAASRLLPGSALGGADAFAADLLADGQRFSDMTVGTVASPVSAAQLAEMDDETLLATMRIWSHRPTEYRARGVVVGGTHDVSFSVSECAAGQPERFARLLLALPEDLDPLYRLRILDGLGRAKPSVTLLARVVSAELTRPKAPLRQLSHLLYKAAHAAHHTEAAREIAGLAEALLGQSGPDTPEQISWDLPPRRMLRQDQQTPAHTLTQRLSDHLRSLPVYDALQACAVLAADTPMALRVLAGLATRLSTRPDPVSRTLALIAAHRLIGIDDVTPLETLRAVCCAPIVTDGQDQFLREADHMLMLASRQLHDLMIDLGWKDYDRVAQQLAAILRPHPTPDEPSDLAVLSLAALAKQRAASALAVAAIRHSKAATALQDLNHAEETVRLGVAEALTNLIPLGPHFTAMRPLLTVLFDDPVDEIARKAAATLRELTNQDLETARTVLEAALNSRCFTLDPGETVRAGARLAHELPDLLLTIAERFISLRAREASDLTTSAPHEAGILARRVVSLCDGPGPTANRALDVLDEMVLARALGLEGLLAVTDR
jgi:hypothetical protein